MLILTLIIQRSFFLYGAGLYYGAVSFFCRATLPRYVTRIIDSPKLLSVMQQSMPLNLFHTLISLQVLNLNPMRIQDPIYMWCDHAVFICITMYKALPFCQVRAQLTSMKSRYLIYHTTHNININIQDIIFVGSGRVETCISIDRQIGQDSCGMSFLSGWCDIADYSRDYLNDVSRILLVCWGWEIRKRYWCGFSRPHTEWHGVVIQCLIHGGDKYLWSIRYR